MIRYTIKAGKQNFKPREPIFPRCAKGFEIKALLDESCWWSSEDWQGDRDRQDWNKLAGITSAFSANNKRSAMIAWRPADAPNTFLLTAYTNDKKGGWQHGRTGLEAITVHAGETFKAEVFINEELLRYEADYRIITARGEFWCNHKFDKPLFNFYRRIGTWIGGANNSPGDFGGEASQDMSLELDFIWL